MYNYMIFKHSERKLYKDFLSYYKRSPKDEVYYVSVDDPEYMEYLEEFLERRIN